MIYRYLEQEGCRYAICLPGNKVLYRAVEHLLKRPVGSPSREPKITYHGFRYAAGTWEEERRAVLKMLADGKVPAAEGTELLKALSGGRGPGAGHLITRGVLGALVGALAVAVGYILPRARVRVGGMEGYQAGYHVGDP